MKRVAYSAVILYGAYLPNDITTFTWQPGHGWWHVGGNQGGMNDCGHKHRTRDAANSCGERFNK